MNSLLARKTLRGLFAISLLLLLSACATQSAEQPVSSASPTVTSPATPSTSATPSLTPGADDTIVYTNTKFNFTFALPLNWSGFTVLNGKWVGMNSTTGKVVETGPLISLRHPFWTSAKKRQDIPIMVFTIAQWNSLIKEDFHIGAAPIPPSELARSSHYVFALPARYNYAFPTGYQEVEEILKGNPLQAIN